MFDLDPSLRKRTHLMVRQRLADLQTPIPVFYIRPDKMVRPGLDSSAWHRYYPPAGAHRKVAFNTTADYDSYTNDQQHQVFGRFLDYRTSRTQTYGPMVSTLARMVDASRFKYAGSIADSIPVYNVINVHGAFDLADGTKALLSGWSTGIQPKTPEQIAAQAFLTLQCGAQGVEFDELRWDGSNLGIADHRYGLARVNWDTVCSNWPVVSSDTLWTECDRGEWDWANPPSYALNAPRDTMQGTPQMWLGLRSRYLAVQRVSRELRKLAPIYQRLYYRQEQISAHDTTQRYTDIPMLLDFAMERADTGNVSTIASYATKQFDSRPTTYAEITHFYPGDHDGYAASRGSRYLMITNRRTWPIDHARYGRFTKALNDTSAARGFGFIDVRRPHIRLRNTTEVVADSFLIERVGYDSTYNRIVDINDGDSVALDWLEPGWGALYRITPIPRRVSKHATAYPNAVKGVSAGNLRWDDSMRFDGANNRVIVYDRDSLVYIRIESPTVGWSPEVLVSDSSDIDENGASLAYNYHPTVAVIQGTDAESAPMPRIMVAWERHEFEPFDSARVVAKLFDWNGSAVSARLDISPSFTTTQYDATGTRATPAIVGVPPRHTVDGGFVVAWAAPSREIQFRFINGTSGDASDVETPDRSAQILALTSDSIARFPSLAYTRKRHSQFTDLDAVHLAFQQGTTGSRNHIIYAELGLAPKDTTGDPHGHREFTVAANCEHVSRFEQGCSFEHPTIAVDSVRIGVAFEVHGVTKAIALKFRGPAGFAERWQSPAYKWGRYDRKVSPFQIAFDAKTYTWPSLTQFPAVGASQLSATPLGALAWQWETGSAAQRNAQVMYWYGRSTTDAVPRGQFAGLTLAPFVDTFSIAPQYSTLLYRGVAGDTVRGTSAWGTQSYYFPLRALPMPAADRLQGSYGGAIIQHFNVIPSGIPEYQCGVVAFGGGLITPKLPVTPTPKLPPVSPAFFLPAGSDTTPKTGIDLVGLVARTGVFETDEDDVSVRRVVAGTDSLIAWLNTPAFNPPGLSPANIGVITELVRASDSVVLWHDDTLWARDVADSTFDDEVEVPTSTATSKGTLVYVRLRPLPSPAIVYEYGAGFWMTGDTVTGGLGRRGQRARRIQGEVSEAELALTALPNPSSGDVRFEVATGRPGMLSLTVSDQIGRVVMAPQTIALDAAGLYALPWTVDDLPPGVYYATTVIDGRRTTTPFTIVR
jgi:hypothetical protein